MCQFVLKSQVFAGDLPPTWSLRPRYSELRRSSAAVDQVTVLSRHSSAQSFFASRGRCCPSLRDASAKTGLQGHISPSFGDCIVISINVLAAFSHLRFSHDVICHATKCLWQDMGDRYRLQTSGVRAAEVRFRMVYALFLVAVVDFDATGCSFPMCLK